MPTNRWWVYQRERFPVLAHGPLILAFSFSAVTFSSLLSGAHAGPKPAAALVAFVSSFIFFLQLRIADEFKDYEEDARYRPYRAVPRGLVRLPELGWVAAGGGLVQLLLACWWAPPQWQAFGPDGLGSSLSARLSRGLGLPGLLCLTWLYLALMSKEFFVRSWIKARPFTYMWTHMLIMPLIDLYATACHWMEAERAAPSGLFWFLLASYCNGVVVEIGRKIRAPADEEEGVQTYTALWGRPVAVAAWLTAITLTLFCASQAAARIDFVRPLLAVLGMLLASAAVVSIRFLLDPVASRARRFEQLSGLWTLLLYLSLGPVPFLVRHWI